MKLAIVCTEKMPLPAVRGGAIQMMIDGICPFLQNWYTITAFCAEDPNMPREEVLEGIHYIRLPGENYLLHVANEIRKETFDIIHICNRPKFVPVLKEAAPHSILTLSLHNEMFAERKLSLVEGRSIIEQVSLITAVSNYIQDAVLQRFPEAAPKLRVLYSGVDLDIYPSPWSQEALQIRDTYRNKYGLHGKKVILFAGRLSKVKGPDLLIRAMDHILAQHPEAVLVIAGGRWFSDDTVNAYVSQLHQLADPYGEQIRFTRFIPADEIQNLFFMSDVFVCSSQWQEPLARVHYEAMAAGTPIVTTDRGGNKEVILNEYTGLLVRNYSHPEAYAAAIHRILSEPETARWMAENGRRFVEANFQFKHVAERLHLLYKQIPLAAAAAIMESPITEPPVTEPPVTESPVTEPAAPACSDAKPSGKESPATKPSASPQRAAKSKNRQPPIAAANQWEYMRILQSRMNQR